MRQKVKVRQLKIGNMNYVFADVQGLEEFFVYGYEGDEAEIEVPAEAVLRKVLREVEDLKRRVAELEKAVMPRATA